MVKLKQAKVNVASVQIGIKFKGLANKWGNKHNSYTVSLKNGDGKKCSYTFYDCVYNTMSNIFITNELIQSIVEIMKSDYFVDEERFPTYNDFASEFGYEMYDMNSDDYKQGKKTYKECLSLGKRLQRVLSKDWIDAVEVAEVLS